MTFVLTEISHAHQIVMASDSSELITNLRTKERSFNSATKTLYCDDLNIGVSTWGLATIGGRGVNSWLQDELRAFSRTEYGTTDQPLTALTQFLAAQLDVEFSLNGSSPYRGDSLGFHLAGYDSKNPLSAPPGMCHVYLNPGQRKAEPELTLPVLPPFISGQHLRNGMFEPFAIMWPTLSGVDETFKSLIEQHYKEQSVAASDSDNVKLRAEWVGNWVKQMCNMLKQAGIPRFIGEPVVVLTFNAQRQVRWFEIPEIRER